MTTLKSHYTIPSSLLTEFAQKAIANVSSTGLQNETLAIVTGFSDGQEIMAKRLIFPKQHGSPTSCEDLGMFKTFFISTIVISLHSQYFRNRF